MNDPAFQSRLSSALNRATAALLSERNASGYWEGELSSSALSTATAVTALALASRHGTFGQSDNPRWKSAIESGLRWLAEHANQDGGWGDTSKSLSNISTTTLCWAAFGAAGGDEQFPAAVHRAEVWLSRHVQEQNRSRGPREKTRLMSGKESQRPLAPPAAIQDPGLKRLAPDAGAQVSRTFTADELARAIIARYGKDRTFSVPILTTCALAGRLGGGHEAWRHVIPLPFELAACPHQLFAALRLPVVSYALPALIAIGQARHVHAPSRNPIARLVRSAARSRTLRVLTEIQPDNGGFLEATPLTSFVTMSLAASGQANHMVTQRGLQFLLQSQRADGSWPIDTNLATWCTTLAIDALAGPDRGPRGAGARSKPSAVSPGAVEWLLQQQHQVEHPYTHAAPGGWAWTDLPGGVPDADDTSGALLALASVNGPAADEWTGAIARAAESGIQWLLDLQNRDGGIPTFCRGWGALPFDRSSADITAHAIRAWLAWGGAVSARLRRRIPPAIERAVNFLVRVQQDDGAWSPLWFGNEHSPTEENLTYGTARVVRALAELDSRAAQDGRTRGVRWLLEAQRSDGSWSGFRGGEPSIEETALATEALACIVKSGTDPAAMAGAKRGADWLARRVESGEWKAPSPIGFYFAKLWYYERLYPMIFTVGALRAMSEMMAHVAAGRRSSEVG